MSYVFSIRIRKELKEMMDRIGINWSEEIKKFLEERVREELRKMLLDDAKRFRSGLGIASPVSADELIREDREHVH
ncbi:MAG TPA: hypothetical protein EYH44_02045 [Thermoprotei archaeon]|nr:hypothetical protein [Thermoprotei archaeon]